MQAHGTHTVPLLLCHTGWPGTAATEGFLRAGSALQPCATVGFYGQRPPCSRYCLPTLSPPAVGTAAQNRQGARPLGGPGLERTLT